MHDLFTQNQITSDELNAQACTEKHRNTSATKLAAQTFLRPKPHTFISVIRETNQEPIHTATKQNLNVPDLGDNRVLTDIVWS
jgi:hypothetical protein